LRRVPAYVTSGLAALSVAMLMMPQPVPHGRVVELAQQLCAAMLPPIVADREDDAYREHRAAHYDAYQLFVHDYFLVNISMQR
jgi:histone acetyltransferase (RNA polymerase elongator complex component)